MQIQYDIPYKTNPLKTCDVYRRRLDKIPSPAIVILIHGGVWSFGSKQRLASVALTLCHSTGCVCIIPEYSLSELNNVILQHVLATNWILLVAIFFFVRHKVILFVTFCVSLVFTILLFCRLIKRRKQDQEKSFNVHPVHCVDIATCIQWVHSNAQTNTIEGDSNRIVLIGHSAGAHIAVLVVLNPRFIPREIRQCIRGVVCLSGVYCFFQLQRSPMRHFVNNNVFSENGQGLSESQYADMNSFKKCGCDKCMMYFKRWETIVDAWPMFHTKRENDNENTPTAFLLLTSDTDFTLIDHAIDFTNELHKNQWKAQHLHCKGTNHFSIRKHWDFKNKYIGKAVSSFILTITK